MFQNLQENLMNQLKRISVILLSAILISQCAILDARRNLKNCNFSLEDVSVQNMSLAGVELILAIGIDNPNSSAVIMDKLDMDVFLNNQNVGKGHHAQKVEIPSGTKKNVNLQLKASYAQMGTALMGALRGNGPIPYKLVGTAHLQIPLVGGSLPFPFTVEDQLER